MIKVARDPIAILAQASKADLVRQVAVDLEMSYEELPVLGKPGLIRFRFAPMTSEDEQKVATLNALHDLFLANWAAGKVVARSDHLEPLRAHVEGIARLTSFACTSRSLSCCPFAVTEPVQEALRGMSLFPSIFHRIAVDQPQERYSLLHVPSVPNDAVVFPASRFFVGTLTQSLPTAK